MYRVQIQFSADFTIVAGNQHAQVAAMILDSGDATGGPDNRHPDSDQWLYVVSGEGTAIIEGQQHELKGGTLVLIERGESHEIRNTGAQPLETINFYVPPAYT